MSRVEDLLNKPLTRRGFLVGTGVTLLGLGTAAMCGGSEKKPRATEVSQGRPKVTRVAETPTPMPEPTATPEIEKYQEALSLLDKVKDFFDPAKNPQLDERLSQFNIDLSIPPDNLALVDKLLYYTARKPFILEQVEQIKSEIRKDNLEEADLAMRRSIGMLVGPLKIPGDRFAKEPGVIKPEEGPSLDPAQKFGTLFYLPEKGVAASGFLRPALELFIQARYKLP